MGCSISMRTVAPAVPSHRPTCRDGCYPLISQVFSIFCNFFYIHCSNSQYSKDFLCACFSSAEVTSRYTSEQSLMVLLQLQAADCEISFVLSLIPLIVKKSKRCLIECRAAAVFSKDSRSFTLPLVRRQLFFFVSFFFSVLLVFEHALKIIYQKKREKKQSPSAAYAVCLTTSLSVVKITRCCRSSPAF